jgi:hypothetical protein
MGWLLAILLSLGLLLLVGFIANALRSSAEKRRARGIEPDKVSARDPTIR